MKYEMVREKYNEVQKGTEIVRRSTERSGKSTVKYRKVRAKDGKSCQSVSNMASSSKKKTLIRAATHFPPLTPHGLSSPARCTTSIGLPTCGTSRRSSTRIDLSPQRAMVTWRGGRGTTRPDPQTRSIPTRYAFRSEWSTRSLNAIRAVLNE